MAKLKAGSSGFHHNLKTFNESLSSQQATLLSELHVHATMEASSSSSLPEAPCGKQVPKDPPRRRAVGEEFWSSSLEVGLTQACPSQSTVEITAQHTIQNPILYMCIYMS